MNLIETVSRLPSADDDWWDEDGLCFRFLCDRTEFGHGEHAPDCPWRSWPRVLAALMAAQDAVDAYKPQHRWADVMLRLEAALR